MSFEQFMNRTDKRLENLEQALERIEKRAESIGQTLAKLTELTEKVLESQERMTRKLEGDMTDEETARWYAEIDAAESEDETERLRRDPVSHQRLLESIEQLERIDGKRKLTFKERCARITPETMHRDEEWLNAPPVGREWPLNESEDKEQKRK